MEPLDAAVARIARRQHQLITVAQLDALGMSRWQRGTRISKGQLCDIGQGILRINGAEVTWESQLLAAILACGRGATASHRSAAVLWVLEGVHRCTPEITVPRGTRFRRAGVRVHESTDLDRTTLTTRNGIPVTLVGRTLLDLGTVLPPTRLHLALDYARRNGLVDWEVLLNTLVVHARKGRPGVGVLRALLDEHHGEVAQTDSGFERLAVIALGERGIRQPVIHHPVPIDGTTYHPDLCFPDLMIAIELDGGDHLRPEVWEDDHVRQNALINAGYTVLRFTWREYTRHLDRMIRDIQTALRRAHERSER